MRLPRGAYPIHVAIGVHLPQRRPAQPRGLVLWVYGAVLGGSACPTAVALALLPALGPRGFGRPPGAGGAAASWPWPWTPPPAARLGRDGEGDDLPGGDR